MIEKHHKVALITGAARRVGAYIAETFHAAGYQIIVHYRQSVQDALSLTHKLNQLRAQSAIALSADLDNADHYEKLILHAHQKWQRLDVLINNASSFSPTPMETATTQDWENLFNSNLKAPFFLSQKAARFLSEHQGNIINIVDIHALSPMKNYPIYSCAKAGLAMLTKSLALELAPMIRVNAVAPGCVMWPEGVNTLSEAAKKEILSQTLLQRQVSPQDIAKTALFLAKQVSITGQMINVDGGRLF